MLRKGFTLLELLITLSIIAILATLAYPAYTHHINKVERHQAKLSLLQLAQRLEHFYTIHNHYNNATAQLNLKELNHNPSYTIKINQLGEHDFIISATPKKNAAKNCGALSINQIGQQIIIGNQKEKSVCWGHAL
ncbi:MAG: prepilin-type N-terminal cleavage/methylation domain-containing protein [Gammaproteobacteria bacterium]|nr:prepilin-type N-terminal cleavage/methylation domain-containing protein [Gammaproteobacteria bacterium]MCH9743741.1 prepilin-type N-terminal cleavage/methylation domain-containing protein [Gammaproteobacteria bacterium]